MRSTMKGCFTSSRMFLSALVCAVSFALRTIIAWQAAEKHRKAGCETMQAITLNPTKLVSKFHHHQLQRQSRNQDDRIVPTVKLQLSPQTKVINKSLKLQGTWDGFSGTVRHQLCVSCRHEAKLNRSGSYEVSWEINCCHYFGWSVLSFWLQIWMIQDVSATIKDTYCDIQYMWNTIHS